MSSSWRQAGTTYIETRSLLWLRIALDLNTRLCPHPDDKTDTTYIKTHSLLWLHTALNEAVSSSWWQNRHNKHWTHPLVSVTTTHKLTKQTQHTLKHAPCYDCAVPLTQGCVLILMIKQAQQALNTSFSLCYDYTQTDKTGTTYIETHSLLQLCTALNTRLCPHPDDRP